MCVCVYMCAVFMIGQIRIATAGSAFIGPSRGRRNARQNLINLFNRVHVPTRYRFRSYSSVSPSSPPSSSVNSQTLFFLTPASSLCRRDGGERAREKSKYKVNFKSRYIWKCIYVYLKKKKFQVNCQFNYIYRFLSSG